jgi:N6-L-threonylcarbamoyladenine synthase
MRNTKNYDFSFSGLKTSALYYVRDNPRVKKADVAASFERAATDVLAYKTERAVREYEPKSVLLCGGVAANACLRKKLGAVAKAAGARFHAPVMEFNTDNAAMIAAAAYIGSVKVRRYRIIAQANLNL